MAVTQAIADERSALIDGFTGMTRRAIARDGFAAFVPTLWLPERKDIRVLEGIPAGENVEPIAIAWAGRTVTAEENYLLAYRFSSRHFKVISRIHGQHASTLCGLQM